MLQSGRTFRIFVSSTFSDLSAERNALQERVFPRLRELAMAHGCRFQAIDLRWGVSEEAALDQQTMRICLGEIERCRTVSPRPNFVVLLGSRYGWRPLPYAIPADELERLVPLVSPEIRERLLWRADQPAGEEGWYRRDDNAAPPEYVLLSRRAGSKYAEYGAWADQVERPLVEALESAALQAGFGADALDKYTLSATGQEIVKGALATGDAREHVFCFFREIEGLPEGAAGSGYLDAVSGATQRQAQLKARLRRHLPANVHEYTATWKGGGPTLDHLDGLCDDVYACLSGVMLTEIGRLQAVDPLEKENAAHLAFAAGRARGFAGRADHLESIARYVAGREPWPLLIEGISGSGKSALMARAVQAARENPQAIVVGRFIGATPDSSNGRALLEDVCRQITRAYQGDESAVPSAYRDLAQALPRYLALASAARPLILFLDALDQLSAQDGADQLAWLPTALPASVRLVLSTLPGQAAAWLAGRLPTSARLELKAMLPSEGAEALDGWLYEAGRRLTPTQRHDIVSKFSQGGGLPLHLKLAFEEARCWHSYDGLPVRTDGVQGVGADIPGVIDDMFSRLEQEGNHGRAMVARALGYLAAARNGLSEDELLDLLWADPAVRSDFFRRSPQSPQEITALPVVAWSRLYLDLERYLAWRQADGTELLGFYHRQLREAAEARFCGPQGKPDLHRRLAAYFGSPTRPFWLDAQQSQPDRRKTAELAYQQASAGLAAELSDTLTTFEFLHARLAAAGAESLIGDYDLRPFATPTGNGEERREGLRLIQGGLRLSAHILKLDAGQLPSQLLGRLQGFDLPEIRRLLDEARACGGRPWLRPLTPCLLPPGGAAGRTLSGHTGAITAVAALPDGRHAVSASGDWSLKLWDLETGEVVRTFTGHTGSKKGDLVFYSGSVVDVEVLPDGRRILSASLDDTLKVWDLETGEATRTLRMHSGGIRAVAVVPGGRRAVVACNGVHVFQLSVLDLETGAEIRHLKGHEGQATAVAALPDGRHALSATHGGTLYLWDLESYEEILTIRAHAERVHALAVLADGRQALSASEDGTLRLWDLETGAEVRTFAGHSGSVNAVALLPDGRHFLSASGYSVYKAMAGDNTLRLWRLDSGESLRVFRGHADSVDALAVLPDGTRAVSASVDGTLKVWDLPAAPDAGPEAGTEVHSLPGHEGRVDATALLPDGRRLLTGSRDGAVKLWDMATGTLLRTYRGHAGRVNAIVLLAGSETFLSASNDKTLILWDLQTGVPLRTYAGHTQGVSAVAVHPDGRRAVSASWDSSLRVWDLETGAELLAFRGHTAGVTSVAILPDGKGVLSFDSLHGPMLWNIRSGKQIRRFDWGWLMVQNGTLLPRGRQVLSFYHHNPKLWRLRNGKIFRELGGHTAPVTSVALLPDGKRAISTSEDQTLKLWDLKSGRAIHTFTGHTGTVRAVALLPNGLRAISASEDRSLRLWDLDSGECLCSFHADGALTLCAAGNDGRFFAGDAGGGLHFLSVEETRPTAGRPSWLERLARLGKARRS